MIRLSEYLDFFMQNLLRIDYENILLKTSANLWGDYQVNKGTKDIRRLTDYYLSDSILGFKEIDAEQHPGWLVRYGTQGYGAESEYCMFSRYS